MITMTIMMMMMMMLMQVLVVCNSINNLHQPTTFVELEEAEKKNLQLVLPCQITALIIIP
ncbi:hypothetical protein T4D_5390 [Trichinella pseudospiralis]|uniref:Uncharacterized protein n=1 Tax=Trichinella pseudospiralis TaxID=6337 RepID=A0A0V1FMS3_TRIPS|nr:hypothetical protein T4D_5390 [Trichinella pseudospiralis]